MSQNSGAKSDDTPLPFLPLPPNARGPLDPPLLGAGPPLGGAPALGTGPSFGPSLVIAEGVLTKAAGIADDVFDAFHGPAASVHTPATKAANELAGWESAKALKTSLENWEKQTKAAEGWLVRIAESLRSSSHGYTGTDQGVQQQFSALRGIN